MRKTEITTELGLQGKVFFKTKVTSGFEARQSHDLEVHIMTVLRYLLSPFSPHKGKNYQNRPAQDKFMSLDHNAQCENNLELRSRNRRTILGGHN